MTISTRAKILNGGLHAALASVAIAAFSDRPDGFPGKEQPEGLIRTVDPIGRPERSLQAF
jgi:hypothetical protein